MSWERELQARGAEQLKALEPIVVKPTNGDVSWSAEEDLRVQEGV